MTLQPPNRSSWQSPERARPQRRSRLTWVMLIVGVTLVGCVGDSGTSDAPAADAGSTTRIGAEVAVAVDAGSAATPLPSTSTTVMAGPTASTQAPPVVAVFTSPIAPPLDENAAEPVIELGSIEIPKLGVIAPLFEGIRLSTFDRGPGHWPGTAMPGQFGNSVIGGHRTSSSRPFRYLDRLVPGDEVILSTADGTFVYAVDSTEIVTPDVVRVTNQNPGFSATLFACHPVGSTRERIIVHLTLTSS